jgi:hypothetical protein
VISLAYILFLKRYIYYINKVFSLTAGIGYT